MKWWLRIALLCGALPLVAGLSLLGLFCFFDSNDLMVFGVLTLFVGSGLFVAGMLCLIVYTWLGSRAGVDYGWKAMLVMALLIVNFPAAGSCIVAGVKIDDARYRVHVFNRLDVPVTSCRFIGPRVDEDLGAVEADAYEQTWFFVRGDGQIRFVGAVEGKHIERVVDDQARKWSGDELYVTITPEGVIEAGRYSD